MNTDTDRADYLQTASRFLGMLMVGFAALFVVACSDQNALTGKPSAGRPANAPVNASAGVEQSSYAEVVARVTPAVVTVRSERRGRAPQQFPFLDDPSLREFFGDRLPQSPQGEQPRVQRGLGSGVVVSPDGYILTNHHVVDGAEEVKVELADRRILDAKIVGTDPPSDLAVLKVEAKDLVALPLGDSDEVRVGDIVLAVGNPLGLGQTVTSGIISAKNRSTGLSDGSFEDFLQTDAAINQGNSGGALVNRRGELVGINSQILSPSGGNIGIGFAIPTSMARTVMEQLIKTGKVTRGQLGVGVQPVTQDIAASIGLGEARGIIVSSVQQGSAADKAGVRQGDVITVFDGASVNSSNELRNRVASMQPGAEVTFTILRDGREQQLRATLGELRAPEGAASEQEGREDGRGANDGAQLGVGVEPLTPETATQLGLPNTAQGLVVREVDPEGPAADAGIREGDVISEINRQPVCSVEDVRAALARSGDRPALLLVNRRGSSIFLTVRPRR